MNTQGRYYLFKAGRLVGPLTGAKVDELRQSKKILEFSWIMDETTQTWAPIDQMPKENPFQATLSSLKERTLSGAVLWRDQTLLGSIKGIHSFGLELLVTGNSSAQKLTQNSVHTLNLIDETNQKGSNSEVIYQGHEKTEEGILLRFSWRDAPSALAA